MKLQTKIFIGLAAGVALGSLSQVGGAGRLAEFLIHIEPLGAAFIRLITMMVLPLVVASVFVGVTSLGDVRTLGRVGGRTVVYYLATTGVAAVIGLVVALVARVGLGGDAPRAALAQRMTDAAASAAAIGASSAAPSVTQTILDMISPNLVASASRGDLLPLIIGVCLFAAAATTLSGEGKVTVVRGFQFVGDTVMVAVRWLMGLAPAAVFILVAATVAQSGLDVLRSLAGYVAVVLAAMAVHLVVVLMPILRFGAGMRPVTFVRGASDAIVMAFSTASSSVTLPVSLEAARTRLGVPATVADFVLPAGATLNKNGAAVYKAVTAVYIAHLSGLSMTPGMSVTIVLTSTLASFAGAGVPGSSLVTTMIVLNAIGLGAAASAGIALVTGIDRPLDMCRTAVNTIGNLVGATWIGRGEAGAVEARPGV